MLPVKVIAPTPMLNQEVLAKSQDEFIIAALENLMTSAKDTNTDASPPRPLNTATICGIAVIATFFENNRPQAEPRVTDTEIGTRAVGLSTRKVTTIASSIAREPIILPSLAVFGDDNIFKQIKKPTDATKKAIS